jgi:indole-3-glycerol phosphate synthase
VNAGFLQAMADSSRRRVASARQRVRDDVVLAHAQRTSPAPALALHPRFDVIAEVKLRSPAAGPDAAPVNDLRGRVAAYAAGGAAAVSVLTEPSRFDGSIFHLVTAARALDGAGIPAMRKDFLVDPYQLAESRIAGAGGALLILRLLGRAEVESLVVTARGIGLFVLLEAFDEADLRTARAIVRTLGPEGVLVGVNCRDLATLQVVPGKLVELAAHLPDSVPCVAESGLHTPEDVAAVAKAGYRIALVGSALMKRADPESLVNAMVQAGRTA